jgi:hypothetical protein
MLAPSGDLAHLGGPSGCAIAAHGSMMVGWTSP